MKNTFLCRSGYFIQCLTNKYKFTSEPPLWRWKLVTSVFCTDLGLLFYSYLEQFWGIDAYPTTTLMRVEWLANMTFLCRSGYFMQFLAKKKLVNGSHFHRSGGLANMTFPYSFGQFVFFITKMCFSKWTQPNPMKSRGLADMKFFVQIWTFHTLSIKIIISKISINPLTNEGGAANLNFVTCKVTIFVCIHIE